MAHQVKGLVVFERDSRKCRKSLAQGGEKTPEFTLLHLKITQRGTAGNDGCTLLPAGRVFNWVWRRASLKIKHALLKPCLGPHLWIRPPPQSCLILVTWNSGFSIGKSYRSMSAVEGLMVNQSAPQAALMSLSRCTPAVRLLSIAQHCSLFLLRSDPFLIPEQTQCVGMTIHQC